MLLLCSFLTADRQHPGTIIHLLESANVRTQVQWQQTCAGVQQLLWEPSGASDKTCMLPMPYQTGSRQADVALQ